MNEAMAAAAERFVVLCTVPDAEVGRRLARLAVERRLAACVNLLPGLTSIYRWQGAVHEDAELLLLVKTTVARLPELTTMIESEHPYECPEVVAVPVAGGSRAYLEWIAAALE